MASLEVEMWVVRFQRLDCWKKDQRSQEGESRRNEKSCIVKWRTTPGSVVKTNRVLLAPSMGKGNEDIVRSE